MNSLSIVIPYFNEFNDILQTVDKIVRAIEFVPYAEGELIVVDDGSEIPLSLDFVKMPENWSLRVINNLHKGRFQTRIDGATKAQYRHVLFCDSRVQIESDALIQVVSSVNEGGLAAQNGWVLAPKETKLLGLFWESFSRIFWWKAFKNDDDIIFTIDNFHQYPKGTGLLLIRRAVFLQATQNLKSHFIETERMSDDTLLLQRVLESSGLVLNKKIRGAYLPRVSFVSLFKNCYTRGYHAIDSFFHDFNLFAFVILVFLFSPFLAVTIGVLAGPLFVLGSILICLISLTIIAQRVMLPIRNLLCLLIYLPIMTLPYYCGLLKGLQLLSWKKLRGIK